MRVFLAVSQTPATFVPAAGWEGQSRSGTGAFISPGPQVPLDSWANPEQDIPGHGTDTGQCIVSPSGYRWWLPTLTQDGSHPLPGGGQKMCSACSGGWMAGDPVTRCRFGFGTHSPKMASYFASSNFHLLILVPVAPGTFMPREYHDLNASVSQLNEFP